MPIEITKDEFNKEVEQSSLPVLLDFYAPWCGPCRTMEPIIEKLDKELSGKYKFVKINVDESRELGIKFGVTSIPTFLFIKNGQVLERKTGYMSEDDLRNNLKNIFEK